MTLQTNRSDVGSHVAAVYNAMLAEYDQIEDQFYFAECYQVYRETVERIICEKPDGMALDLGCGTGKQTVLLARRAGRVVGIDISDQMIEAARRRCNGRPNVSLVTGDITRLPFEDGCVQAMPLGEHERHDASGSRAERLQHADLARALEHRHQDGVQDA